MRTGPEWPRALELLPGAEWHTHVFLYIYFLLIILCRSDDEESCDEEYYDTQRGVDNPLVSTSHCLHNALRV